LFVLAVDVELHIPLARSLKARRAAVRPIVEGCRQRFGAAVAEVAHQELWQRAGIGVAVVAATAHHASERMDEIERWLWSRPDVEVVRCDRHWLDLDG
jgi:uncharacterized protein